MLRFVVIVVAIASISMTMTRGKLFEPLRKKVQGKGGLVGYLATCTWCMLHWWALLAAVFLRPINPAAAPILPNVVHVAGTTYLIPMLVEYIVVTFVLVAAALPICLMVYFSVRLMRDPEMEKMQMRNEILQELADAEKKKVEGADEGNTPAASSEIALES